MGLTGRFRIADWFLFLLLLVAFLAATRMEALVQPGIVPFAQVAVFSSVALLLMAAALRRGLAHGVLLANTDELTGLDNRRSFTEVLSDHLFDRRARGVIPALLLLDLDRFKVVNDTLGHPAGDEMLKVVAQRLRSSLPPNAFVSRLGGDEFAVIMDVHDPEEATMLAGDILAGLNRPVMVQGHEIWPNASIGIALCGAARIPPGELLRMADVALYQAKGRGKGRWFLFDSSAHVPSVSKLSMESELHGALNQGQFEMLYQPVVDLKSRQILGAEALLRWNHPTLGVLTPDAFLPIAEETGIGRAIGRWILEEVSVQVRTWQLLFGNSLSVSINLSAAQFQSADFVRLLARAVRESGAEVHALNFEVAEGTLTLNDTTMHANLAELRDMGFKVAIDDFGVGFSSLNYLQTHGMDILKLDPAFVRSDDANARTFRIIRSIIELAHSLSMTVVAEGVETEEQYQRMLQAGCDQGQGYYFAHPMHPQELTDLLAQDQLTLPVRQKQERRGARRPWSRSRQGEIPFEESQLRQRGA